MTHGAMNSRTPSTTSTPSLATTPGAASDHSPSIAMRAPRMIIVHSTFVEVSTQIVDSAATTPSTTCAQSCQRVHVLVEVSAISATSMLGRYLYYAA